MKYFAPVCLIEAMRRQIDPSLYLCYNFKATRRDAVSPFTRDIYFAVVLSTLPRQKIQVSARCNAVSALFSIRQFSKFDNPSYITHKTSRTIRSI